MKIGRSELTLKSTLEDDIKIELNTLNNGLKFITFHHEDYAYRYVTLDSYTAHTKADINVLRERYLNFHGLIEIKEPALINAYHDVNNSITCNEKLLSLWKITSEVVANNAEDDATYFFDEILIPLRVVIAWYKYDMNKTYTAITNVAMISYLDAIGNDNSYTTFSNNLVDIAMAEKIERGGN